MIKIATWNVNSLNVRLPQVQQWVKENKPDVFALQETKLIDEKFPVAECGEFGYRVIYSGQKSYNGVAILSCLPAEDILIEDSFSLGQKRILCGTIQGIRIINLYVPNGEHIHSEKYHYKLNWLTEITNFIKEQLAKYEYVAVLGDFNIAPEPQDVYNPKRWENQVLFSPPERAALSKLLECGLVDTFRLFPQPEKSYTWWDYRIQAFTKNLGLRIDHILVNQRLAERCSSCTIDKTPRGWERPSDHTPVFATFA